MFTVLRPFLAALLTLPLRALAGWLTARGIEGITEEKVSAVVEAALVWGLPLVSTLGIIGRRLIDKWANPGNAASSHVASVEKELSKDLKRAEAAQAGV